MISMAHEIEKLRGELANADKRARAAAAAAAAANPGISIYCLYIMLPVRLLSYCFISIF